MKAHNKKSELRYLTIKNYLYDSCTYSIEGSTRNIPQYRYVRGNKNFPCKEEESINVRVPVINLTPIGDITKNQFNDANFDIMQNLNEIDLQKSKLPPITSLINILSNVCT